jgi:hypothetical protein
MTNARRKGVRLGRPAAAERPHVARHWPAGRAQLAAGALSKRAAARQLRIGVATLERLLAAPPPPPGVPKREGSTAVAAPA